VNHGGGEPPGYSNTAGDDAAFNVIILTTSITLGMGVTDPSSTTAPAWSGCGYRPRRSEAPQQSAWKTSGRSAIQIDNQSTEHPNVGTVDGITLAHWEQETGCS